MSEVIEKAVLVTTVHRGVFFGYTTDDFANAPADKPLAVNLRAARNCVYWSSQVKGFLGLATVGPLNDSRRLGARVLAALGSHTSPEACLVTPLRATGFACWPGRDSAEQSDENEQWVGMGPCVRGSLSGVY